MAINEEQGFPSTESPLVMATGSNRVPDKITPPWYRLLLTLWNRTGGSSGSPGPLVGEIKSYGSATPPTGYLPCDGAAVSRTSYADLFAAISTTWGIGDGSTTFNVPDLRGRSLVGDDGVILVGDSGGAATAAIGIANLPAHNHGVTDPQHTHAFTGDAHGHALTDPGHTHPSSVTPLLATTEAGVTEVGVTPSATASATTGITLGNTTATGSNANAATGITTQNTGGGTALPIRNPYAGVLYIIKT